MRHAATCHRSLWHFESGSVTESCTCCDARFRALYGEPSERVRIELRTGEKAREYDAESGEWLPVAAREESP